MRKHPEGFVEIEYEGWIFPKCFQCDGDILLVEANSTVFIFKCDCRERVSTAQNYEIVSKENVVMQTLFFNKHMQREYVDWYAQLGDSPILTKELYMKLKRFVVMEEI